MMASRCSRMISCTRSPICAKSCPPPEPLGALRRSRYSSWSTAPCLGDRVLEIGTGSGYLTACLALLATHVTSLEIRPALAQRARQNLLSAGIANVEVEEADAFAWDGGAARFDVVILTGSLPSYDNRFEKLLRPGGRLLAIVGEAPVMEAVLVRLDSAGQRSSQGLFETVVEPLTHALPVPAFSF